MGKDKKSKYNKETKSSSSSSSGIGDLQSFIDRAVRLFHSGQQSEADQLLSTAEFLHQSCESSPTFCSTRAMILASIVDSSSNYSSSSPALKDAILYSSRAASLSPSNIFYAFFYATLLLKAGRDSEAYEEATRGLSIDPSSVQQSASSLANTLTGLRTILKRAENCEAHQAHKARRIPQIKKLNVQRFLHHLKLHRDPFTLDVPFSSIKKRFSTTTAGAQPDPQEIIAFGLVNQAISFHFDYDGDSFVFYSCCSCSESFLDAETLVLHIVKNHMLSRATDIAPAVPAAPDQLLIQEIKDERHWSSPYDLEAALQMLDTIPLKIYIEYLVLPVSGEEERLNLLKSIGKLLRELNERECLSSRHVRTCIRHALDEVHRLDCWPLLRSFNLNERSTFCIRFARTPVLRRILDFLDKLMSVCNIATDAAAAEAAAFSSSVSPVAGEEWKYICRGDSCVVFDLKVYSKMVSGSEDLDVDALLEWMYKDPPPGISILDWAQQRKERRLHATRILVSLNEAFNQMSEYCLTKTKNMKYMDTLECLEGRLRHQSYDAVLRRLRGVDLCANDVELMQAVDDVHREFEDVQASPYAVQGGHEDPSIREDDDPVKKTIQKLKGLIDEEICLLDVKIMQHITSIRRLKLKLGFACATDYVPALVPFVQELFRISLEDQAERFVKEASVAEQGMSDDKTDPKKVNK